MLPLLAVLFALLALWLGWSGVQQWREGRLDEQLRQARDITLDSAQQALADDGLAVRVVSMPSTNVFDRQDADYKASVLPAGLPRIAVEAGSTDGWYKYVGLEGRVIGLDRFGESAPASELFKYFGITADAVVQAVKSVL